MVEKEYKRRSPVRKSASSENMMMAMSASHLISRKRNFDNGGLTSEEKVAQIVTQAIDTSGETLQDRIEKTVVALQESIYPARVLASALLIKELTTEKDKPGVSGLRILESLGVSEDRMKTVAEIFHISFKIDGYENHLLPELRAAIDRIPEAPEKNLERRIKRLYNKIFREFPRFTNIPQGDIDPMIAEELMEHIDKYSKRKDGVGRLAREKVTIDSLSGFAKDRVKFYAYNESKGITPPIVRSAQRQKEYWTNILPYLSHLKDSNSPNS
jgi:hypothetical protein